MEKLATGRSLLGGTATGSLLVTSQPISFWGGYDQASGEIIDRGHELSGQIASGSILAFPYTKGSSTTTAILLESVRAGVAPAGFIMVRPDNFIALAAVVAEEMYGVRLPIVVLSEDEFSRLETGTAVILLEGGEVVVGEQGK